MLQIGTIVNIYKDYQTEKELLGKGLILEILREGLTFILEDNYEELSDKDFKIKVPEALTEVYSYCRCKVEWVELSTLGNTTWKIKDITERNIRYLYNIGLQSANKDSEDYVQPRVFEDKFLTINGVEVF